VRVWPFSVNLTRDAVAATILDTPDMQGWCHVFALRMCGRPWRSVQWRLQVTHCQYSTLSCMKRSLAECSFRAAAQYLQIGGVRVMRRFSIMAVPEVTARQDTAVKRVGHLSTVRRTCRFGVESTPSIGWGVTIAWARPDHRAGSVGTFQTGLYTRPTTRHHPSIT
jgi:hypothetical protein